MGFAEIRSFWWGVVSSISRLLNEPAVKCVISSMFCNAWKMHLSAEDCVCISVFWGLRPHTLNGALPLDPAKGLLSPRPPVPPLPPNPGYVTVLHPDGSG